ncbi:pancreatic triacylglycerol lipase-like isoform X2 [Vespa velutina]|uniref:pancreatic triacylglycerol lipase-like isoform X2 n=1 Tax=Vespa velutina TaxID=202808 RepID=UPI001FB4A266|nr:pancreatic triacylglycerol lipase-like isoform X2 [Vespa velutina]
MINVSRYVPIVILISSFLSYVRTRNWELDSIFLRYYDNTLEDYVDEKLNNASFLVSRMDKNKPTVFYIHGFMEDVEKESVTTVVCAYLQRKDHNILIVDYRNISKLQYVEVVLAAKFVGYALALALNKMVLAGLNSEKLHIVSHSLGSQIAGHIGKSTSFKIPRITDAQFVDIIHTDYGFYGISRTTGIVDFFPNGGHRLQPGCSLGSPFLSVEDFCSHHRSWKYYAESLINENSFMAVKCSLYREFLAGKCNENLKVPMGFATSTNALVNRISNFVEITKKFNYYLERQKLSSDITSTCFFSFFYPTITISNYIIICFIYFTFNLSLKRIAISYIVTYRYCFTKNLYYIVSLFSVSVKEHFILRLIQTIYLD